MGRTRKNLSVLTALLCLLMAVSPLSSAKDKEQEAEHDQDGYFNFGKIPKELLREHRADSGLLLKLTFDGKPFSLQDFQFGINGIRARHPYFYDLGSVAEWSREGNESILTIDLSALLSDDDADSIFGKLNKVFKNKGHFSIQTSAKRVITKAELVWSEGSGCFHLVNGKVNAFNWHGHRRIERNPPAVEIDRVTPSENPTSETSIRFEFHTQYKRAKFECSLDGSSFEHCKSPLSYSGLKVGSHQFSVRAKKMGVTGKTAQYRWTISSQAPKVTIQSAVPAETITSESKIQIFFVASPGTSVSCQLDGQMAASCVSPVSYSALGEGRHTVTLIGKSASSSISSVSYSWTVDKTPPQLQWGSTPASLTKESSAQFSMLSNELVKYQCSLDGSALSACGSPVAFSGLLEGSHSLAVVAFDEAGNASPSLSYQWVIDQTGPVLSIGGVSPSQSPTNSTNFSFSFSSSEPASFSCWVNGALLPGACVSPIQLSGLREGGYTLTVVGKDSLGNQGQPIQYSWVVDLEAPSVSLHLVSPTQLPTQSGDAVFKITPSEPVSFDCRLDGYPVEPCSTMTSLSGLAEGNHNFVVVPVDFSGNTGVAQSFQWEIDRTAPEILLTGADPVEAVTVSSSLELRFQSSEAAILSCELDSGGAAPCASPYALNGLMPGSHELVVRGVDAAGNKSLPSTYAWRVVDIPSVQIVKVLPSEILTSNRSVSIEFSSLSAASYQCSLDGAALAPCQSPAVYTALSDGLHSFEVQALNEISLAGAPASYQWTVDTLPAQILIGDVIPAKSPTKVKSLELGFSTSKPANVTCALDGGAGVPCQSPYRIGSLEDGEHVLALNAVDLAGNQSSQVEYHWVIDSVPGQVQIVSVDPAEPLTNKATMTVAFSSEDADQFFCSLDSAAIESCSSPHTFSNLGEGSHSLSVYAEDAAGNRSSAAEHHWVIDTVAPIVSIISKIPAVSPTNQSTLSIAFVSDKTDVTFHCSVDEGLASPCLPPYSVSDLAAGVHTLEVYAVDGAGNQGTTASATWTIDSWIPKAQITSVLPVENPTSQTQMSLSFVADKPGSSFLCSVDGGLQVECSSPYTFYYLSDLTHTVAVRAKDSLGNVGPAASYTWTVDTSAPVISLFSQSPIQSPSNQTDFSIVFTSSKANSNFYCSLDSSPASLCFSPYQVSHLANGVHSFSVYAEDLAHNRSVPSSVGWVVDTTPPQLSFASIQPSQSVVSETSISVGFSANKVVNFYCKLDGGSDVACQSPFLASGLANGQHTLSVFAEDLAGNTSPSISHSWTVDTVAPVLSIVSKSPAVSPSKSTCMSILFSSSEAGSFSCSLDGAAPSLCASPFSAARLTAGEHSVSITAIDLAGNHSAPFSYSWTVDLSAPAVAIQSQDPSSSPTNSTSMSISFAASESSELYCSLDGASPATCTSPYQVSGLASGVHQFSVYAVDSAGNRGASSEYSWMVDTAVPVLSLVSTSPSAFPTNSSSLTLSFQSNKPASFSCSLDGQGFASCASPYVVSGVGAGNHTASVRAVDAAGNVSVPLEFSWEVDLSVPVVTINSQSPAQSPTNQKTMSLTFSANEAVSFFCNLDGSTSSCSSPYSAVGLSEGSHHFEVVGKDSSGNASQAASYDWVVDSVVPVLSLQQVLPANSPTNSASLSLGFSSNKTATFSCALDGGTAAACTSPYSISGLSAGSHEAVVVATDSSGNSSLPLSYSWVVDTAVPVVSILSKSPAVSPTNQTVMSVSFSANETVSFFCSLDGSQASACSSPYSVSGLIAGNHSFSVFGRDAAGNQSTSESYDWVVDTAVPLLSVIATSPSSFPTSVTSMSLSFSASKPVSFSCALDGGSAQSCSSPYQVSGLASGEHAVSIVGTDSAGNASSPLVFSWLVDTAAPVVSLLSKTPSQSPTNETSMSITFSANDIASPFFCSLDGSPAASCSSPYSVSGLGSGSHSFSVYARDAAGNQSAVESYSWVIDTAVPVLSLGVVVPASSPTNSTSLSLSFSANKPASFTCVLDGGSSQSCSSPYQVNGLGAGAHSVVVLATDAAGNSSLPLNYSWVVDTAAPSVSILSKTPAVSPTNGTSMSITFTASESSSFYCSVDGSAAVPCSSPRSMTGFAAGNHIFAVYAKDPAGNQSATESYAWVVDTTAPVLTLGSVSPLSSPTNNTSFSILFSSNKPATFSCRLDAGTAAACSSPYSVSSLGAGSHSVSITGTDAAGNVSSPLSYSWVIDTTAPVATINSKNPSTSPTNSTSMSVTFSADETSSFFCAMDAGSSAPCTSPFSVAGLTSGTHTFSVFAKDVAGNQGSAATYSWTIDNSVPVLTLGAVTPSAAVTNNTSISIAFSANKQVTYSCSRDGGNSSSCSSPYTASDLSAGNHSVSVVATDAAGNISSPLVYSWSIDLVAPTTSILSKNPAVSPTNLTGMSLTFSASETASFFCSVDGGTATPCSSPHTLSGLSNGSHSFSVYARDAAGNQGGPASYSWVIDGIAPTVTLGSANPSTATTKLTTMSLGFSASEPATFQCSLDAGAFAGCSSPVQYSSLANGSHTISVRATDATGNQSSAVSYSWSIDLIAPSTSISSLSPSWSPTALQAMTIGFTASETASFFCSLDGGAFSPCSSAYTVSGLLDGSHSVSIYAVDLVGNVGNQISYNWVVNSAPLTTSNVAVSQITQTTAQVSWHTSVPASTQVIYGVGTALNQTTPLDPTPVLDHTVTLTGLNPFTLYSFKTNSVDQDSRTTASNTFTFRTLR